MRNLRQRFLPWFACAIIRGLFIALSVTGYSQTWEDCKDLGISRRQSERAKLDHNTPSAIVKETLDRTFLRHIAHAKGLTEDDLKTIKITATDDHKDVMLYQFGPNNNTFEILGNILELYGKRRLEGHTKDFLLLAITNAPPNQESLPPHIRILLKETSLIPVTAFQKYESGTATNEEGRISSWVIYTVTDGDITWSYSLSFKSDGAFDRISTFRHDAKEFDPKYREIIKEVESEITQDSAKEGTPFAFGVCHSFWKLKKDRLQAKGILWRSPAELNPNCRFD